jgi:hypothetical protein
MHRVPFKGESGALGVIWGLVLLLALMGAVVADTLEEYSAKAALAFNFARYTDWPESTLARSPDTLHFCVAGDLALIEAFQALSGKRIGERHVRVNELGARDNAGTCDLIFIDHRDRRRIAHLLSQVRDRPVLTIGEVPGFADYGGIINLYRSEGRFRFEVSPAAARRANLAISSRLLRLARIVE